jgi:ribosomal protein S18 acetylase RimI-like enzyme
MASPLDNPMWRSLTTRHAHVALAEGVARRYPAEIAPFAGIPENLRNLTREGERVGLLNVVPSDWCGWQIAKNFDLYQYVWEKPYTIEPDAEAIKLTNEHIADMLELTALVYPAYFRRGTAELGDYFGIYRDGRLAAMGGVRMSFDGFQEISAICTHPDHRGQGLAGRVSRSVIHHIENQGDVPFLHTEVDNSVAQKIYEGLGLTRRATLPFFVVDRTGD